MPRIDNVIYTGKTHTEGGRNGKSHSDDRRLDILLYRPGSTGPGTNPEQLFAAGWSACFIGAMGRAAATRKIALPADVAVDAEVDLGTGGDEVAHIGAVARDLRRQIVERIEAGDDQRLARSAEPAAGTESQGQEQDGQ